MLITRQHLGWALCASFAVVVAWIELKPEPSSHVIAKSFQLGNRAERIVEQDNTHVQATLKARLSGVNHQTSHAARIGLIEEAVARGDRATMAEELYALGMLAFSQQDLDSADLWLSDALAEYEALDDERGRAVVLLDLGRLHVAYRERAKRAAYDYDDLLLARWAVAHGHHVEAARVLEDIVQSSLSLDRYGTAASALTTLFQMHLRVGDTVSGLEAGQQALALHASAGNEHAAQQMLLTLRAAGLDQAALRRAEGALAAGVEAYRVAATKLGLVRDYTQLYHQLMARGDPVSAWRYRRQAEELRRGASRRAMYRRQPDVLVELYRSNRSLERAANVLRDAEHAFEELGMVDEMLQSAALQQDMR